MIIFVFLLFGLKIGAQPLEEMEYILRFGFIKGGKATLTPQTEKLNKMLRNLLKYKAVLQI
jgi:hypothetical protein